MGVFVWNFTNFLKNLFFTEHLWWLLMGTGIQVNTKFFESSSILEELGFVAFEKLKYWESKSIDWFLYEGSTGT